MKRDWQTKLRQILTRNHRNGVLIFVICHDPERCLQAARIFSPDAYVLHGITGMRPATAGEDVFLLPEEKDITWLNMNRPFLNTYPAKYVLFVTEEMYLIFRSQAPDFTDWASHQIFTFEEDSKVSGKVGSIGPLRMFHGTRQPNLSQLEPSRGGEYGPGLYLTPTLSTARFYANVVASGAGDPRVLTVEVDLEPSKIFYVSKQDWLKSCAGKSRTAVQNRLRKKGYDALWATGISGSEQQLVLFDATKARIVDDAPSVGAIKFPRKMEQAFGGVEEEAQMQATEIEEFAKRDPVRALQNPNIPIKLFKSLIQEAPLVAFMNPTFPLFLLEEPELRGYVARFVPEWLSDADFSKNNFWLGYSKEETAYFMKRHLFMREMMEQALPYLGNFAHHPIVVRCIAHLKGEGPDISQSERRKVQDYANNYRDSMVPGSNRGYFAVTVVTTTSPATMLRFLAYAITGTAINDNGNHDNIFIWGWNRFLQLAFGVGKNTVIIGANDYVSRVMQEIEKIQQAGITSANGIARELTNRKVPKSEGQVSPWSATGVQRIIKSSQLTPEEEQRNKEERVRKIREAARRQWENMTPEQLKANTSKQAEAIKKKYAEMTPEQRLEHTAQARKGASNRLANMTPEERAAENLRLSAPLKKWIESLTPEEYEAYKAKLRENAADLSEKSQRHYQNLPEEEKQKISRRMSEHKTNWWNNLSPEELELQRQSLIDRLPKRLPMSEEEIAEWRKRLGMDDEGSIGQKKPSSVSEQQDLYNRWKGLINMTTGQLQRFLSSDEGKLAGLSRAEASEQGIKSGHDSARALLRMIPSGASLKSALANWTKTDWEWAKRQVSFISRMRGNAGPLFDEKGRKTRKHTSLLLWGHDPRKKA